MLCEGSPIRTVLHCQSRRKMESSLGRTASQGPRTIAGAAAIEMQVTACVGGGDAFLLRHVAHGILRARPRTCHPTPLFGRCFSCTLNRGAYGNPGDVLGGIRGGHVCGTVPRRHRLDRQRKVCLHREVALELTGVGQIHGVELSYQDAFARVRLCTIGPILIHVVERHLKLVESD